MRATSRWAADRAVDGHSQAGLLRLDRAGWISPLIVRITLFDDTRFSLIYPGDIDDCNGLLRHLRRLSRDALIDGIPYRQYWGEVLAAGGRNHCRGRAIASCCRKTRRKWSACING